MSRTFKELYRELEGNFPGSNEFLAQFWLNRAWSDIRNSRQWSFLRSEGVYYTPVVISTGTFSVTVASNQIVASASARTALNNLSNPVITKRQIRFNSGPIYSIVYVDPSFASNGILKLDRLYREPTNAAITYQVYRCYFNPPETTTTDNDGVATTIEATDFLRFNSIYQPSVPRYFKPGIIKSLEWLNMTDPNRTQVGQYPCYMIPRKYDSNNQPIFEMWPHYITAEPFIVSYQKRGVDLTTDSETLPSIIPDNLVLERANFYGCGWAAKNVNKVPELKGINWTIIGERHNKTYSNLDPSNPGLLEQIQTIDEEQSLQNEIIDSRTRHSLLGDADVAIYSSINS
jgi:hypothetical protein